ncbi:MAG: SMC-Scp complex subunit ScpB [Oscillospiraceae bacterium]|jgi:segregation and condensation protein B|nr:SMC-Scp complex subunit ScpB [Oscillospiraceae bacterium]
MREQLAAAEAILFVAGEPLELARLADALETEAADAQVLIDELQRHYDETQSGLCILRIDGKVQICSRPAYAAEVRAALEVKKNAPLSPAAFEVLAVVAYHQPVTKGYVEQVRGVDCNHVMNSLCQKSLIEECGRMDLPGRPLLYRTTDTFLRCFCMASLDELPALPQHLRKQIDENEEEGDAAC